MLGLSSPARIFFIFWEGVIGVAVAVVIPLLGVVAVLVVVLDRRVRVGVFWTDFFGE